MSRAVVWSLVRVCVLGLLVVVGVAGCGVERAYSGGTDDTVDMGGGGCKCPTGQVCCASKCVNPKVDPTNCGACGKACAAGETCENGNCSCAKGPRCPAGQVCCTGSGCRNLMTDANNCGMCGKKCDDTGLTGDLCYGGKCGCGLADTHFMMGEKCCLDPDTMMSACIGIQTDVKNCGDCSNSCGQGQTCDAGMCMGGGGMLCGGMMCAPNETCMMGICIPMGGGGMCMSDADCKMGQKCVIPILKVPCPMGFPLCACM